jgi:hypothetical protein
VGKQKLVAIILGSILGLTIISSCSIFAAPHCVAWEFNTEGESEGWQTGLGITAEAREGYIVGNITQPKSFWVGSENLDIDTSVYKTLEVRYRVASSETSDVAYFYWVKEDDAQFGNNKRVKFEVLTDNTWQEKSINLTQSVNWNGVITGVRLCPAWHSSAATSVEYDYIRLCK